MEVMTSCGFSQSFLARFFSKINESIASSSTMGFSKMKTIKAALFRFLVLASLLLGLIVAAAQEEDCVQWEQETFIVKIGGSCLTDKATKETLNNDMLDWFSQSMSAILRRSNDTLSCSHTARYIVVHGAGSFGHFTAKEYGLRGLSSDPNIDPAKQDYLVEGVAETRRSVQTLNQHVILSLLKNHVPAVGLSPLGLGLPCPNSKETKRDFQEALQRLLDTTLDAGFIPVLHGDACLYGAYGAGILGGDTLLELLGSSVQKAIFITDVPGIYTSNPHVDPDATLVDRIEIDKDGHVIVSEASGEVEATGSTHEHDVTGGLAAKLGAAATIAKGNTPVTIVQCGTISAQQALRGSEVDIGTLVLRKKEEG
jgi:isopentenyl phosphate kinase